MVPTPTVARQITRLENKQGETTDIFENVKRLNERVPKPPIEALHHSGRFSR